MYTMEQIINQYSATSGFIFGYAICSFIHVLRFLLIELRDTKDIYPDKTRFQLFFERNYPMVAMFFVLFFAMIMFLKKVA